MTATAAKDQASTVGSTLTAGPDGGHGGTLNTDTVDYQWQLSTDCGTHWSNLAGKNTEDTTYDGFKSDATPAAVNFTVASGAAACSYKGRLWTVQVRLRVTRTTGTLGCVAFSSPVTLKAVEGDSHRLHDRGPVDDTGATASRASPRGRVPIPGRLGMDPRPALS